MDCSISGWKTGELPNTLLLPASNSEIKWVHWHCIVCMYDTEMKTLKSLLLSIKVKSIVYPEIHNFD